MWNRQHSLLQLLLPCAILVGLVFSPASSIAAKIVEMNADGVQKEVEVSEVVARSMAILKKCGGGRDLARRFLQLQDEMLLLCKVTSQQRKKIKMPFQIQYTVRDCSVLSTAVNVLEDLIKQRTDWNRNLKIVIPATQQKFTCG